MKVLKYLLLPFSFIYLVVVGLRGILYSSGIINSYKIPVKSICIGNLSVGGTGKSPLTIYLAQHFSTTRSIAILSRGYGRSSSGFLEIQPDTLSNISGDEPSMYAKKHFPNTHIFVCEKRAYGIQEIIQSYPKTDLVLLDDAYQHRAVTAGFNILLTDYNKPFFDDLPIPAGRLRESKNGKSRADMIVVSKSPKNQSPEQKGMIMEKINVRNTPIYFASIDYSSPIPFGKSSDLRAVKRILLITAIADASSLIQHLKQTFEVVHLSFPDHHTYTDKDLFKVHQKFDTFVSDETAIFTTEKDWVKLTDLPMKESMKAYPWFYQPMSVVIDREEEFLEQLNNYVDTI